MKWAGELLAFTALSWPRYSHLSGALEDSNRYGQFRRRRLSHRPSTPAATHPSTPCFLASSPPEILSWGLRRGSRARARPLDRRQYSQGSCDFMKDTEGKDTCGSVRSPGEAGRSLISGAADSSIASAGMDTLGGVSSPPGASRTSKITRVEVENLKVVDSVSIELGRGLIAITGETGAGKSLISSAFSLAAGARVRGSDLVGSKGSTATVRMQLELAEDHCVSTANVLRRLGVPLEDGGTKLGVTRTIGGKGSSASVNGCSVKVGALRELMSPLIYAVDANAFELFSKADGRLRALDRMLNPQEIVLADKVRRTVAKLKQAEACRIRLEQRCRFEGGNGGDEDASLLHHWVEELDEFCEGEMAFMNKMRTVVDEFVSDWGEEMLGPLSEPFLWGSLSGEDEEDLHGGRGFGPRDEGLTNLWPRLSRICECMEDLEASRTKVELAKQLVADQSHPESISHVLGKIRDLLIDAEDEKVGLNVDLLEEMHEDLNSLEDCVKRAGEKLERSVESLPVLPISLEEVEERTVRWRDLSRKHGVAPERLGSMQAELRVELDELVVAAEALPLAREKEAQWRAVAEGVAGELSEVRRRAAMEVEQLINPMMPDVGLEGVTIKVLVEQSKALAPTGADRVQFLMEANQGLTRGTVDAVASSGEKSRLLLLLETRLPPPRARSSAELIGEAEPGVKETDADGYDGAGDAEMIPSDLSEALGVGDGGADDRDGGAVGRATPPCAVLYDEIDAHVGGRTAVAVGRLLKNQGRDSQVVVVTHTASVAALADQHLVVDKATTDSRSTTSGNGAGDFSSSGSSSTLDNLAPQGATSQAAESSSSSSSSAAVVADELSLSARRSRRGEMTHNSALSVSIREVRGQEREEEVARMAAGDMGGGAAAELAREMLRYSRRQRA